MTGLLRATWILFGSHLTATLRSRRLLVCALLALGPVAFAFTTTQVFDPAEEMPVALVAWMLIGQVVCPVVALVFASNLVSEEVEDRTITYLFTRPFPRAALLLGRWLAAMVVVAALLAASTLGTLWFLTDHFTGGLATGPWLEVSWPMVGALVLGAAVYSAGFALLGTLVKHPMIVGLFYTGAFEFLLVNLELPGSIQELSLQYHLRSIVKGAGVEAWSDERIFRMNELAASGDAVTALGIALAVFLVLGSVLVSRREFVLAS